MTGSFGRGDAAPRHRAVAAGIVEGDKTARTPVLNGLQVVRIQSGQLVLTFDGYSQPQRADGHMYIVNAMPVAHDEMTLPVIALESFAQDGIVLRITDPDGIRLLPLRFLVETEFIIEVTGPRRPLTG